MLLKNKQHRPKQPTKLLSDRLCHSNKLISRGNLFKNTQAITNLNSILQEHQHSIKSPVARDTAPRGTSKSKKTKEQLKRLMELYDSPNFPKGRNRTQQMSPNSRAQQQSEEDAYCSNTQAAMSPKTKSLQKQLLKNQQVIFRQAGITMGAKNEQPILNLRSGSTALNTKPHQNSSTNFSNLLYTLSGSKDESQYKSQKSLSKRALVGGKKLTILKKGVPDP